MQGLHHNVKSLITLMRKAGLKYDNKLNRSDVEQKIKEAYQNRKKCKKMARSLSLEYRHQLAQAKEEAGETAAATYIRNLDNIEAVRKLFRNIRHIEDIIRGGATNQVVLTDSEGNETEITERQAMEAALLATNERKYHQCEGGSQLLLDECIAIFGKYGEGEGINKVLEGNMVYPRFLTQDTRDFLESCKLKDPANVMPQVDIVRRFHDFKNPGS